MATSTGFPTSMAALNTSTISYSQYRIICKPITFKRRFVIGRGRSGVPLNPRCGGMPEEDSDSRGSSMSALERLKISGADRYTKEKSSIIVLGLSIHTAPVETREKLAIPEAEYPQAIRELCGFYHIEEAAVLSTCNRVEIYVVALSWHCGVRDVTEWMEKTSGVAASELRPHLFLLRGSDAINHLFEVSAGLDSLILGDEQILGRVKQVVNFGEGVTGFGRSLNGLFRYALRVGADVLTKTNIASGPIISVSSAAVELAIIKLPQNLSSTARVLVIGAGKMGRLVINHLVAKGWTKIVVVNRSEHRVDAIREDLSGVEIIYKPLTEMLTCAGESDVVFTSTASNIPLFMKDNVETLPPVSTMNGGSRLFFDISVPRNVGSCVSDVENTQVYNVDDFKEVLAPKMEAMEAQAIVAKNLDDFRDKMDSFETVPTIKNLRALVETIRITELERCLSKIKHDIPKKTRRAIEDLSRGMMNKVLHGPMEHLRCDESNNRPLSEILENMHALNRMFSLETDASILEQKIRAKMEQSRKES